MLYKLLYLAVLATSTILGLLFISTSLLFLLATEYSSFTFTGTIGLLLVAIAYIFQKIYNKSDKHNTLSTFKKPLAARDQETDTKREHESTSQNESISSNDKCYLSQWHNFFPKIRTASTISTILIGYYLIYDIFDDFTLLSGTSYGIHIDVGWQLASFLILTFSAAIYPHLCKIKLTFYRIFLQSIFDQNSKIYELLHHGYLLKILVGLFSISFGVSLLLFMILIKENIHEYVLIVLLSSVFIYFDKTPLMNSVPFVRSDIADIFKSYFLLFGFFFLSTIIISGVKYFENTLPINDVVEVLKASNEVVAGENITWRPLRVLVKHIYALENIPRYMLNIPWGKELYICYYTLTTSFTRVLGFLLMAKTVSNLLYRGGLNK